MVGSVLNFATGIGSAIQNKKFFDKRLAFDKEQNDLNRQYNLNLAKKQNQWSIDQWNRENAYNTPSAQRQRMAAAGLNPDLVYGNGAGQSLAASSPDMTSGAPSSPTSSAAFDNRRTIGELFSESSQAGEALSRIALNQATKRILISLLRIFLLKVIYLLLIPLLVLLRMNSHLLLVILRSILIILLHLLIMSKKSLFLRTLI